MRKYLLICIILLIPFGVKAKVYTCNNINTQIEIEKDTLKINETSLISLTSEYDLESSLSINNDILDISENNIIKALKSGEVNLDVYIKTSFDYCVVTIPIKVLSNDSSLKDLTIEGFNNIFNKNKYDYQINVPYNIDSINIKGVQNDSKAQVTGLGKRYLNVGNNNYEIIVTAEDGTISIYKINIIRSEANSDASLKSLKIDNINFSFNKDIYEYHLEVDNNITNINILATPNSSNATVIGNGKYNLSTGKNFFYIVVTSEFGNEINYSIEINRKNSLSKLNSLEVKNYNLNKPFDSEEYNYTINVYDNIKKLDILATADDNDEIEITGNDNLVYGENEIIITVKSNNKGLTSYKLVVNKIKAENKNNQNVNQNNILLNILFILFIISIIIMITVCGIFIKINYKKRYRIKRKRL